MNVINFTLNATFRCFVLDWNVSWVSRRFPEIAFLFTSKPLWPNKFEQTRNPGFHEKRAIKQFIPKNCLVLKLYNIELECNSSYEVVYKKAQMMEL